MSIMFQGFQQDLVNGWYTQKPGDKCVSLRHYSHMDVIALVLALGYGVWFGTTMMAIRRSLEEIRDTLAPKRATAVDRDDQQTQRLVELIVKKG
jgi:hypothetical protein